MGIRRFIEVALLLGVCAAMGTMTATTVTCGVGLLNGTDTWCGVGLIWLLAVPISVVVAWVTGALLMLPFHWLKLQAWWHYAGAGLFASVPVWLAFARPFTSVRWQQSGPYDSLNYLGTGLLSSVLFWLVCVRGKSGVD